MNSRDASDLFISARQCRKKIYATIRAVRKEMRAYDASRRTIYYLYMYISSSSFTEKFYNGKCDLYSYVYIGAFNFSPDYIIVLTIRRENKSAADYPTDENRKSVASTERAIDSPRPSAHAARAHVCNYIDIQAYICIQATLVPPTHATVVPVAGYFCA